MPTFKEELNEALQYDLILEQFADKAAFEPARQMIRQSLPRRNPLLVQADLEEAREAMTFLQEGHELDFRDGAELENIFNQARVHQVLEPRELFVIRLFLKDVSKTKNTFETSRLRSLAEQLDDLSRLQRSLDQVLNANGEIKMDATEKLRALSVRQSDLKAQIRERSRSFIQNHASDLMEPIATTYNGRTTFLVKASAKNKIRGLVHGSSQSGAAYYLEPEAFIHLDNDLFAAQSEMEAEIVALCRQLTNRIRQQLGTLRRNVEIITQIDLALAKARWAIEQDGSIPSLLYKQKAPISIRYARHPLLSKEEAVHNDYSLSEKQRGILITGPNMGGKTVSLKTIALFEVLAHAGFPVSAESMVSPFFTRFYFDLSDSQSILNHLSTFSGHMDKLAKILRKTDENSFIVLDEIGNGTDPSEGAALAQAVLESLVERKVTFLSTTHFERVKRFARTSKEILVSSMEFDEKTLKPTYRYLENSSSSSFAFHIAAMMHVDKDILSRAQELQQASQSDLDVQMKRLEDLQKAAIDEKKAFEKRMGHLHELQREAKAQKDFYEKAKKELDENYQKELSEQLEEKKEEARALMAQYRKKSGVIDTSLVHELNAMLPEMPEEKSENEEHFEVGDYVKITSLGTHGEIVELSRKKATVSANGKKISIGFDQLEKLVKPNPKTISVSKPRSFKAFPMEVNLIGMRVDEGLRALDQYLDQALLHRLKRVRIIHGMGSGKLRAAIWKDLSKRSYIKKYESAGPNQGGLGATVVEFD